MPEYECLFEDPGAVERYGRLRAIDATVLKELAGEILDTCQDLSCSPRILDAGAGTGRFLKPIAIEAEARSTSVELVAVDLSDAMLVALRKRLMPIPQGVRLVCLQGDLQEPLAAEKDSVNVVFTAATFHILSRWQRALKNLAELIAPNGTFVFVRENNQFMHETEGFDHDTDFPTIDETLHSFMKLYHEQREKCGEPYQASGLQYSDMSPALEHLSAIGLVERRSGGRPVVLQWQKAHTYGDILHCFRNRQMTTWGSDLSDASRQRIADALDAWVSGNGINPSEEFFLPASLIINTFRKQVEQG